MIAKIIDGIANLLNILSAATGQKPQDLAQSYSQYGALKVDTGEAVCNMVGPIQERYLELMNDRGELQRLLRVGAEKARVVASATVARAKSAVGFLPE